MSWNKCLKCGFYTSWEGFHGAECATIGCENFTETQRKNYYKSIENDFLKFQEEVHPKISEEEWEEEDTVPMFKRP